jgi:hypothetical protein
MKYARRRLPRAPAHPPARSMFYAVWDVADDRFFRKANDSDATQFGILFPAVPGHVWALLWMLFEVGVLVGFVILGISQFKVRPRACIWVSARALTARCPGADDAGSDARAGWALPANIACAGYRRGRRAPDGARGTRDHCRWDADLYSTHDAMPVLLARAPLRIGSIRRLDELRTSNAL